MDEYRVPDNALEGSPSISPIDGNDPAFKLISFSTGTFTPQNYASLNYDIASMPAQFNSYYTFSSAYLVAGSLDDALSDLFPLLEASGDRQTLYRKYYYSGHDLASPITDANWKVYWCGIGNMVEQDMIDCVNDY